MWKKLANKLEPYQFSVWTEFTPLAIKHQAINLGQGFPSFPCPEFIKQALAEAVNNNENQYCKPAGFPLLTDEIARVYGKRHKRTINPLTEISVSHGASEGLLIAVMSMIDPGDEVVLIDPTFDIYVPQIEMFNGVAKRVSLLPPKDSTSPWQIDFDKLEAAFSNKTRVFYYNTPNNPIGKVFTADELQRIANILKKWPNVAIVADEVYEHITFDHRPHLSLCDFGDLWDRTVTISSAGKIFSVTGWKTGWAVGGQDLIRKMNTAKVWTSFCSNTVCQGAVARGLRIADNEYRGFPNYYLWLREQYNLKREHMKSILERSKQVKLQPILSEGGFFLCARVLDNGDFVPERFRKGATLDFAVCRWMTEHFKVSAIPCSVFFSDENRHLGEDLVRFALCKEFSDYEKTEKILVG